MKRKLLSIFIVAVLLLGLLPLLVACGDPAPAGNPAKTPIQQVQEDVATVNGQIGTINSRLDTMQQDLTTVAQRIAPDLAPINSSLSSLQASVDAINATLADIEARLDDLEGDGNGANPDGDWEDTDPEDAVDLDVRYQNVFTFTTPLSVNATGSFSIPIRLKLDNQLPVAIEDIVLSARATLKASYGQTFTVDGTDLAGDIEWYAYGLNSFESWEDIALGAEGRESYSLTYSATVTNTGDTAVDSIRLTMRFECEDYEVSK